MVQGIEDAERPMGLKERCALGALRLRSSPTGFELIAYKIGTQINTDKLKIIKYRYKVQGSRYKALGIQDVEQPI